MTLSSHYGICKLHMDTPQIEHSYRAAAVKSLAAVGFIALVTLGIWLAVYSTRFVPSIANGVGAAAVYIGNLVTKNDATSLTVVPTPDTPVTLLEPATTTPSVATTTAPAPVTEKTVVRTPAPSVPVVQQPVAPYGLPDLTVVMTATGYMTTTSTDSFVASSTVPKNMRPAVRFSVLNVGTNVTGLWRFSASLPTRSTFVYQSGPQQSLAPGGAVDFTLGFDSPQIGNNLPVSVTVNPDATFAESNTKNNSASISLTIAE